MQACDSHIHIIGDPLRYPMLANRRYTPPEASVGDLRAHLERMGLQRAVVVQPSIYGFDNRCTLQALQDLGPAGRGVAVLPLDVSLERLRELDAQGMRGIRLNLESSSQIDLYDLQTQLRQWSAKLTELGWHIQIYASSDLLAACASTIEQLAVPCVFDHIALWQDADCSGQDAQTLLRLLTLGKIYVKLSASYRFSESARLNLHRIVQRLIDTRADRLLWGSDWPHTQRSAGKTALEISPYRAISAQGMLAERQSWLHSAALEKMILQNNPQQLYRF